MPRLRVLHVWQNTKRWLHSLAPDFAFSSRLCDKVITEREIEERKKKQNLWCERSTWERDSLPESCKHSVCSRLAWWWWRRRCMHMCIRKVSDEKKKERMKLLACLPSSQETRTFSRRTCVVYEAISIFHAFARQQTSKWWCNKEGRKF